MATPVAERGAWFEVEQFGGDYTTPGATVSQDFEIIPGFLVIHVGLARVAAAEAIVGIVQANLIDANGNVQPLNFGEPWQWETALYALDQQASTFTIGAYAARGAMKAWYFIQSWE
jgi:hypothetical protein